jgi:ring-1,2-phenylacetyl-CoA epoxidase subunit PaaE
MSIFNLEISSIKQETADTKTICFKQPKLKKIKYLSGQYLTLIFRINNRKYVRPYSFSSAPGVDDHLEVTIKRVPGGIVSNHINDILREGDKVEVMSPMGDFIFDPEKISADKHVILWGAGSGITPLISIAKLILYKNTGHKVYLVYGNRNHESVIFNDRISELLTEFPDNFKTWHFHTQLKIAVANPSIIEGRISPSTVLSILKQYTDPLNTIHYICGPTGLKESVKQQLNEFGLSNDLIFSEAFESIKNPADFEDIYTQVVEIQKQGQISRIEVFKGKSILEAGLDALIDLEYSCQTGNCMLCKAKITSGEVKTIGAVGVDEKLDADECLLCSSYPFTANVKVSVF